MKGDKGEIRTPSNNDYQWLMEIDTEFAGTLLGFDDYVSMLSPRLRSIGDFLLMLMLDMVLEDVTELLAALSTTHSVTAADFLISDYSGSNTKLSKILLNGNNICMVRN